MPKTPAIPAPTTEPLVEPQSGSELSQWFWFVLPQLSV
jgi:hypothetical protein